VFDQTWIIDSFHNKKVSPQLTQGSGLREEKMLPKWAKRPQNETLLPNPLPPREQTRRKTSVLYSHLQFGKLV
jgi:hypothetical protein